jgi:Ca2+-binding RTX toxin-like protein
MTSVHSRATAALGALVAAGLAALLLVGAIDAKAGGSDFGPRCEGKEATVNGLTGTAGKDVIVGTPQDDVIEGGGGRDIICGKAGDDDILAGGGDDRVRGGVGREFINGEAGSDDLFANGGNDSPEGKGSKRGFSAFGVVGGNGDDVLGGGNGDDHLVGQGGTDEHRGGVGFDGCFDEDQDSTYISCEFGSGNQF